MQHCCRYAVSEHTGRHRYGRRVGTRALWGCALLSCSVNWCTGHWLCLQAWPARGVDTPAVVMSCVFLYVTSHARWDVVLWGDATTSWPLHYSGCHTCVPLMRWTIHCANTLHSAHWGKLHSSNCGQPYTFHGFQVVFSADHFQWIHTTLRS